MVGVQRRGEGSKFAVTSLPASSLDVQGTCIVCQRASVCGLKDPCKNSLFPCSKTREGAHPAVKVERGLRGVRFKTAPDSVVCVRVCAALTLIQVELCCAQSQTDVLAVNM